MTRRAHRILGLVLVLPICAWAVTGLVFFVKPGYDAAYGGLRLREYPLTANSLPPADADWLEVRALRTTLGDHLLVRAASGWTQLDPATRQPRRLPDEAALRRLISDAIAPERARYGEVSSVARHAGDPPGASIETTTGVRIELDWATLGLTQAGADTRTIDALYRIHYLQWTGVRLVDRVVGVIGLALLVALAILGVRLAFAVAR